MKRLLKAISWLLLLLFLLLLLIVLMLTTNVGTKALAGLGNRYFSDWVQTDTVDGSLLTGLSAKRLVWQGAKERVTLDNFVFKPDISHLLQKQLHIKNLQADKILVELSGNSDDEQKPQAIKLPLAIKVDQLNIKQLELVQQKGTASETRQLIEDIDLSANAEAERLFIQHFKASPLIDNAPLQVKADGDININAPYTLDGKLAFDYQHPKHGVAAGEFVLAGDTQNYTLSGQANLESPEYSTLNLQLNGKGTQDNINIAELAFKGLEGTAKGAAHISWKDALTWTASIDTQNIKTARLVPEWPAELTSTFSTSGEMQNTSAQHVKIKNGQAQTQQLKAEIRLDNLEGTLKAYPLKANGVINIFGTNDKTVINIQSLDVTAFAGNGSVQGDVTLAGKDIVWDAKLTTEHIKTDALLPDWPATITSALISKGNYTNEKIQADVQLDKLEGTLKAYPLKASGMVAIAGTGEKMNLDLTSLAVEAFDGKAAMQGDITLAGKDVSWDAKLTTENLKTDSVLPDWPATVTSSLVSKGEYIDEKPQLTATIERLEGDVMGNPLTAQGLITVDDKDIQVKNVKARSGVNKLEVNGRASEPFDLAWSLQGDNLAQVLKGLQGKLSGKGQLQGTIAQPQVSAKLNGQGIRYENFRLAAIDMDVEQNQQQFNIDGTLKKLQIGEEKIESIVINGDGKLEQHKLAVKLAHAMARLDLQAEGGWVNEIWQGRLQQLSLKETEVGNWNLSQPVNIKASQQQVETSGFCLQNQQASVCADNLEWQEKSGVKSKGQLKNIPFSLFKPWLPSDIKLPGSLQADFAIDQRGDKPKGSVDVRLPDNQFTLNTSEGKAETLAYKNTRLQANLNNRLLQTQLQSEITGKGTINADADITLKPESGKHTVAGTAKINMPDISWLDVQIPAIKKLQGSVAGDIRINGQLEQPQIIGDIRLQNTRFDLPETGTSIEQLNLNVQANGLDKANISGSLKSGQGTLNISGQASLPQKGNWQANLNLKGQQLPFMDTYEIQGQVSPDLNIQASPDAVRVKGTLTVPETTITLNELPQSAVYESDDVVIVGRSPQVRQWQKQRAKQQSLPMNIQPDVSIILGNKVNFSGFGLETRLQGRLRIIQPKNVIIAQGNLKTVDGVYKAYGQELTIERGSLVFNGPLSNPGLDLQAVRENDEVKAGIQLTGTVKKPESRLFSIPTMSQNDILSYLLTGRRFSEASGSESTMLLNAVTSLGVSGGESIARQLGNNVGLDSVNITSGADGTLDSSELELGKKLGPNLYLKYIVGIFDSAQKAAIEYQFNKRLRLEAESGLHQGFDLIYRVEKD